MLEMDDSKSKEFSEELARLAPGNANKPGQQNGLSNYNKGRIAVTHPLTGIAQTPEQVFSVNTEIKPDDYGFEQTGGDTSSKSFLSGIQAVKRASLDAMGKVIQQTGNLVLSTGTTPATAGTTPTTGKTEAQVPNDAKANAETTSGTANNDDNTSDENGKVN